MSYQKNEAGQKFMVLAVNTTNGQPFTGDAANITAKISKDFGSFASLTDTNPTELDSTNAAGVYVFDLSQAETNGDVLTIMPSSATANVQIDMLNIYTTDIKATQLDDIEDQVGDIKTKTDQLTFTIANQVDANSLTGGTSPSAVADAVWDESASQHNVGGSFGKFIRQMKEGLIVEESEVDDASATTTSFVTTLPKAVDDYYNDDTLVFISGNLIGQSRIVHDYDGGELRVTFDEPLTSAPADTDEFILLAGHNHSKTQIENTVWNAVEADHQITGSTGKALTDASATGGDATAANQNTIIAKLTTPAVVYTNPSSPNKLTLIRGDAYDDANENNGKLTWATGKTLTGATVRFTIRDASDNILIDQTTAGVSTAVNVQTAEVLLTSAATALLTVATTNKFDAEAYWSDTNRWTFARGTCIVLEDQTRS